MQGDGPHQPLVNELQVDDQDSDSKEFSKPQVPPTPTPYLQKQRAACVGTEFILLDEVQTPRTQNKLLEEREMW